MKALLSLAWHSAWSRRFVLSLVVVSIALSTLLLLGIEQLRRDARDSFSQAVSGTDLIVGARTGPVSLLLYSVFRVGGATNNIRWASVEAIRANPAVDWVVPISLGDSHRGFAVVGTTTDYFKHFHYGDRQALAMAQGRPFEGVFEAVLGAEVARRLGYRLGDRIVLSHGDGARAANDHTDKPFAIVGVLAPTGTPVDRSVHISLAAMEAIHLDWMAGAPLPGLTVTPEQALQQDLTPRQVTAALVGLKRRSSVFSVQRWVANYQAEPLLAVLPGVALDELWDLVGLGERSLMAVSALVAIVSVLGLVAVVLAGLNERRRELAILRAVGAGPRHVLMLLLLEGALVTGLGLLAGIAACVGVTLSLAPWAQSHVGLTLSLAWPGEAEVRIVGLILVTGLGASLLPAWRAYRLALADGLSPRA
ncbi:MAG: ABC transporter permease [Roseateles sp.]